MARAPLVVLLVVVTLAVTASAASAAPGHLVWSKTAALQTMYAPVYARVATAATGDVYVAATADGGATGLDMVLARFTQAGTRKWVRSYHPAHSDHLRAVACDRDGNVIVCGRSQGTGTYRAVTVKFSRSGKQLWARRITTPVIESDARDVITDAAGNVYVTGDILRGASGWDWFTAKFSPAGRRLWVRYYSASATVGEYGAALAFAPNGDLYVAGTSGEASGFDRSDLGLVRYTRSGKLVWTRLRGLVNLDDKANDLAVGPAGLCVAGEAVDGDRLYGLVWKVGLSGTSWPLDIDGLGGNPGEGYRYLRAGIDKSGRLYAAGRIRSLGSDFFCLSRRTQGGAAAFEYIGAQGSAALGLAVSSQGAVYAAGTAPQIPGAVLTLGMTPAWTQSFSGSWGTQIASADDLALTSSHFFVGGWTGDRLMLQKYTR